MSRAGAAFSAVTTALWLLSRVPVFEQAYAQHREAQERGRWMHAQCQDPTFAGQLREHGAADVCARVRPLVLFVTHNLNEALVLADRILFLGDTPARVVLDYRVEPTDSHDLNSPEIAALSRQLLAHHRGLLSEMAGSNPDESWRRKEGV